jgi:hypothetical protein
MKSPAAAILTNRAVLLFSQPPSRWAKAKIASIKLSPPIPIPVMVILAPYDDSFEGKAAAGR